MGSRNFEGVPSQERVKATGDLWSLVKMFAGCDGLHKSELQPGDWVVVRTRNSTYSIYVLGNDQYEVSGGWFDRKGLAPATMTINGCTWGGRVIHTGLIAARGLFLEFGNDVVTTRIQEVRLVRREDQPRPN